jgi:uncharacterized membrane protein
MPKTADRKVIQPAEPVHAVCLSIAALALVAGLVAQESEWVKAGISLVILLPPLRLATSIIGEARARHYGVATMGILVLAFLVFSRRIS